jgi:hypothetical protein
MILFSASFLSNESYSPPFRRKSTTEEQRLKVENIISPPEIDDTSTENKSEVFDDDTSKLTFKEKMILFNKKKNIGLGTSSSLKTSRSRLTQVFYSQTHI